MADPIKYTPAYDFSNFQASNPNTPLPGNRMDIELQNIDEAVGQTITALKDVRRADGKLQNGCVTSDSLDPTVSAGLAADVLTALGPQAEASIQEALPQWRGAWVTATVYDVNDLARENGSTYICLVAHTAGVFVTDLAASRWELFAQQGSPGAGTGDMVAANNLSDVASAPASLVNLGLTATAAQINRLAEVLSLLDSAIHIWRRPLAEIPAGYQLCDGTNGTIDLRDKFIIGAGSTYAVGATGGAATVTLTTAQLPVHTHSDGTLAAASGGSHTHGASTGGAGAHSHTTATIRSQPGGPPATGLSESESIGESAADSVATNGVGDHAHSVTVSAGGAHTHDVTGATGETGSGEAHNNLPPYYALCFIQKV